MQEYEILFAMVCIVFTYLTPCDEYFENQKNHNEKMRAKWQSVLIINIFLGIGMCTGIIGEQLFLWYL